MVTTTSSRLKRIETLGNFFLSRNRGAEMSSEATNIPTKKKMAQIIKPAVFSKRNRQAINVAMKVNIVALLAPDASES
jgi:hypothetical protein